MLENKNPSSPIVIFKEIIEQGFSEEVALLATIMIKLNATEKFTQKDFDDQLHFKRKLIKRFKKISWSVNEDVKNEAMSVWEIWYSYEVTIIMDGEKHSNNLMKEMIATRKKAD
jgi:hypothetical protein